MNAVCDYCRKEFRKRKSRQRFCGVACARKIVQVHIINYRRFLPDLFTCSGCGVTYKPKRRRSNRKYCSMPCFQKNMEITTAKIEQAKKLGAFQHLVKRPWDGKTRPEFTGLNHPNFGKPVPKHRRQSISRSVKNAWSNGTYNHLKPEMRAMKMWGKNSKPGSSIRVKIRSCFKTRQWRTAVFQRDDYICQECGKRGGSLEAHHGIPFATIVIRNNLQSIEEALNCAELWDVSNGITMCKDCHGKIPRRQLAA